MGVLLQRKPELSVNLENFKKILCYKIEVCVGKTDLEFLTATSFVCDLALVLLLCSGI